ncbi:hypothetical protein [Enterobacter sp.]|uniref:hypothetical protein n=1 Tax=Enterobacter sp. TaxID=42895 RepID=UPI00296F9A36|nr:hypothetical protein [Enterobacter sp.]
MNFEQHYGELTKGIKLNGITPYGNSMPMSKMFLSKKFLKKVNTSTHNIDSYMNVIFEHPQQLSEGDVYEWVLNDLVLSVYLIEAKALFVKGKNFWVYAVGIIE